MRATLLSLCAMAACAAPPASPGAQPNQRPLTGTRWVMATDGAGPPTIDFREAGRASGFSGCNQWFAQVDRDGGGLRFGAIGMTRRACEAPAMEIERGFAAVLEGARAAQIEDATLTLIGEDGEELARFTRVE